MPKSGRFKRTTILTCMFASFLLSVGVSRILPSVNVIWILAPLAGIVALHRRQNIFFVVMLCTASFILGWWRGGEVAEQLKAYDNFYKKPVVLSGIANSDAHYEDKGQIAFDLTNVEISEPEYAELPGKIEVRGYGEPMVYRGDHVHVEGKLYPVLGSRLGRVSFAEMQIINSSDSFLYMARRNFSAGMETALPEPSASFGLGLLIGERDTLPPTVSNQLALIGLTHLIAVSGYNLTILVMAVRRGMGKRSLFQTTVFSILMVLLFVAVTGGSASIIRAAFVSILALLAGTVGRKFRPILLIAMVAAITAGLSPMYIWKDIGWYLSFLAFFGILVLAPLIFERLKSYGHEPGLLSMLLIESACAWLMTAPYILYIFGQISWIAVIANLLVVPWIPLAMLVAVVAGMAGTFLPLAAGWFAWPARFLLSGILDIVAMLSRISWAQASFRLPLIAMLAMYGFVALGCVALASKRRRPRATIPLSNEVLNVRSLQMVNH